MIVIDKTLQCEEAMKASWPVGFRTSSRSLPRARLTHIVIHETSLARKTEANPLPVPDVNLDGIDLSSRFAAKPGAHPEGLGTGGLIPYHVLIRADIDATAEQLLPLTVKGAHARVANGSSISIAVVGNFASQVPSNAQWERLVSVIASLVQISKKGLDVVGHTDIPGASFDPNKKCPGVNLQPWAAELEAYRKLDAAWMKLSDEEIDKRLISDGWRI